MRPGFIVSLGHWLHPVASDRSVTSEESDIQFRAGVVGSFCIASALCALAVGVWELSMTPNSGLQTDSSQTKTNLLAIALISFSVFTPQAIFRTRNSARTRELLDNPSTPIQPWQATTLSFDAVLVAGMLAGLYLKPWLTLDLLLIALLIKMLITTGPRLQVDPNARFHVLVEVWLSAAVGVLAYLIVSPLAATVSTNTSPWPMVLAGLAAMALGLIFNATQRWVNVSTRPWALLSDATDSRRLIVALVSASLAWLVVWTDTTIRSFNNEIAEQQVELSSLGVFVSGWLLLWCASILLWRRDAKRTLTLWGEHQSQIVVRLADGSLSNELARRAALPTVARMAIAIFGATRAMSIVDYGGGQMNTYLLARDRYDSAPALDATALRAFPHMHVNCYPNSGVLNMTGVTIASWLWPGWFITRSPAILAEFSNLAALTLLMPSLADADGSKESSFDTFFDPIYRWPTMAAFDLAVTRMQARADANPHSDSLVIAVLAIDEFGALAGGRFEQAAIAQVARLAMGHDEFAGHDLFLAYQAPGRIWLALAGGPIVRNGIALVRGLQQRINDHGSVPAHRLDVEVHVSVSMGYAAHQVDDFTMAGLEAVAQSRLASDASSRNPFIVDSLVTYDIRPEDIIGEPEMPLTAVDVLQQLQGEQSNAAYPMQLRQVVAAATGVSQALLLNVGWDRVIGNLNLTNPEDFSMLINRKPDLAEFGSQIMIGRLIGVLKEVEQSCQPMLPIMISFPSILLEPDIGHLALPNLLIPRLDRSQGRRTVVLVNKIPRGSGQSLRILADRGFNIAVTASAAEADPEDLSGWPRWGIVFPRAMLQGASGVDALTIQQTVTAIGSHDTRLIGLVDSYADARALAREGITWTVNADAHCDQVATALLDATELKLSKAAAAKSTLAVDSG
ncbi:MAG: hypothetical protein Q7K25_07690 [Actinomycetota bacterium]|nr:hypothetical protein [Actinomycetota bacterium]